VVVAIDGFPLESTPGILASLDKLPIPYRWSTRFIFMDTEEAKGHLEAYRKKWKQKQKQRTLDLTKRSRIRPSIHTGGPLLRMAALILRLTAMFIQVERGRCSTDQELG